jgi:hypothetical protein
MAEKLRCGATYRIAVGKNLKRASSLPCLREHSHPPRVFMQRVVITIQEDALKTLALKFATAAALVSISCGAALAQSPTRENTPGDKMQDKSSVKGQPGASGYAPGHLMQEKESNAGEPGASGYAPGQSRDRDNGSR